MPKGNRILKVLLSLGLLAVAALTLGRRRAEDWKLPEAQDTRPTVEPWVVPRARSRRPARRFALMGAFTCLFFAGAAFTAGAGDQAARLLDDDAAALEEAAAIAAARMEPAAVETVPAPEAPEAPAEPVAVPEEPVAAPEEAVAAEPLAEELAPPPVPEAAPAPSDIVQELAGAPVASTPAPAVVTPVAARPPVQAQPTNRRVIRPAAIGPVGPPEIEREHGEPTIWLNRELPDPTPPSARLTRSFARQLFHASKRHGADWALVLGVLRAQGERDSAPAGEAELDALSARLVGADAWRSALALSGQTALADRADALADLYRSMGIEALIVGLEAAQDRLAERLLENEDVLVYAAGRDDIAAGRIDVRVVVLLGYLAERHGSVTISSLFSGHRKFSRPGVVSAHVYGQAVDVAAVGGTAIAGHQQPGGLTEDAVRSVLLLPVELQPQQVISLLGLGGPSFPLRDHGDHIHVGF